MIRERVSEAELSQIGLRSCLENDLSAYGPFWAAWPA
jgi:hypothetical protein